MYTTLDTINTEIRKTPLLDRLTECHKRICDMTARRRTTRISIPPQASDDDFFICLTLKDAIEAIKGHVK